MRKREAEGEGEREREGEAGQRVREGGREGGREREREQVIPSGEEHVYRGGNRAGVQSTSINSSSPFLPPPYPGQGV